MTTLYGSNVANGTLTSASSMSTTTGGTETSALTSHTGSNKNGEIWSQGNASLASVSAIPTTPTGNGWVFAPGAGSYAAGTWGIAITVSSAFQMSTVVAVLSKYSGGSYTSIGTGTITITSASKTAYSLTTSSLGGVTFAAGDLLHIGLWGTVTSGNMSGMNPVVYESSSATAGVAGDMAFTPPAFTPALTTTPVNSEDDLTVGDAAGWQESALASEGLTGADAAVWQMGVLFAEGLSIGESISASAGSAAITYLDSFAGRTVSNGWGTASDGISSWTIVSGTAANIAVASGEGTITSTGSCSIGTTRTDGEILVRFQIPDASSTVGVRLRYTNANNYYVLYLISGSSRIFKMVAGTFTSLGVSGLSNPVIGQFWWGRFQIQGTTLRASVWKDGNTEPAFFQTSTVEASLASGLPMLYGNGTGTSVLSYDHFSFTTALTIPLIASDLLTITETAVSSETFSPSDLLNGASSALWQEAGLFEEDLLPTETCLFGQSPLFEEDLLPTETMLSSETFLPSDLLNGVSSLPWQETTFFAFEEDLLPGTGIYAQPVSPWDLFAQDGLQTGEISLFGAFVLFEEDLLGVSMPVWLPIDAPNFLSEDDLFLTEQGLFDQPALLEDDLLVGDVPGWQSWPIEGLSITDSCIITTAPPSNWQRTLNLTVTSGMFVQRGVSWLEGLASVEQLIGGTVSILPIVDSFFRPDQNGWGTASDGRDTWTHPIVNSVIGGTPDSFIAVNRGRVSNSGENVLLCGGSVGPENDVLVQASFTDPLLSGIGAVARALSDGTIGYQAIVLGGALGFYSRLDEPYTGIPQGLLASIPIALNAGSLYWIHFRVTGAVTPLLQANVWQNGMPEPANWMLSFTDTLGTPIFGADQVGVYLCTPDADFIYAFQGQSAFLESLPMQAEEDLLAGEAFVAMDSFSKTHSLSVRESVSLASLSSAGIPPGTWEEDLIAGEALLAEGAAIFLPAALAISSQAVVRKIFPATAVEALTGSSSLLATETEQRTIQLSLAESALCYSHAAINPSLVTTPFVFAPEVIPVAESMVAQVGTPLTLYLSSTTSATTSAADQIYTISGSPTTAFDYIQVGTATAWGEFLSGGNAGAWPGLTGIGLPSTQGWFLDGPLLENRQLILGLWSATLIMQAWRGTATTGSAAGTLTVDLHIRAWKYNSQVATFELLDDLAFLGASITSSLTSFTFPFLADTTEPFITGERLYLEIWGRIATNGNAASNQMIRIANLSTDSAGKTGSPSALITTPGFAPLTIAPSTWGLGIYGVSTFTAVPLTWNPSELLTLAESSRVAQGAVPVESLAAQSQMLLAGTVSAQESLSLGETFLVTEGDLLKTIPLTLAETFAQTGVSLASDLLSPGGTLLVGESALLLDALSLGESLMGTIDGLSSELLTCQDQVNETAGTLLSEMANVTEAYAIGETCSFGEALSIGEGIAAASIPSGGSVTAYPFGEQVSVTDGVTIALLAVFSEGISPGEGVSIGTAVSSLEALTGLDQISMVAGVNLSEAGVGISAAALGEQVSLTEALPLTETIAALSTGTFPTYLDSFAGRTVSSGWGAASDGSSSWTVVGTAANFAVSGGEGTITNIGGCTIGTAQTYGEILVRFQIPDASSLVQVRLRYTNANNYYALYLNPGISRIFKMVAGAFTDMGVSGLSTAVAGQFWWAHFRTAGSLLSASVWKDGTTEPGHFQTSAVEASLASGLPMLYGSGTVSSVLSYDHFSFTALLVNQMATTDSLAASDPFVCTEGIIPAEALALTESVSLAASLPMTSIDGLSAFELLLGSVGYRALISATPLPPPTGRIFYVSPSGSDSNAGSLALPWLTPQHASGQLIAGDTLYFQDGTYNFDGGSFGYLYTTVSGTASAHITYRAVHPGGAKLTCSGLGSVLVTWYNEGNYLDIQGFDITCLGRIGLQINASHCTIRNCIIHDIPASPGTAGGSGITFGQGVFTDNWVIDSIVDHIGSDVNNQCHGIYMSSSLGGILNCRTSRCAGWGIHLWHQSLGCFVLNNLSYNNGNGGIMIGNDGATNGGAWIGSNVGTTVANNIILNNGGQATGSAYGLREVGVVGLNTYTNNCFNGNATAAWGSIIGGSSVVNSVLADPQLVNYQSDVSGDYHLTASSPCINAGISTSTSTVDIDGYPMKSPPDIGPYEWFPPSLLVGNSVGDVPGWQSWPIESLGLTETLIMTEGALFAESLGIGDLFIQILPMSSEDDLSVSEQLRDTQQSTPIEGGSLLDGLLGVTGWLPLDASSLSDAGAWQSLSQNLDSLSVGENFLAGESAARLDALSGSDSALYGAGLTLLDALSVSDVLLGGLAVSFADILGIAESLASTASLTPKEGLSGVDGLLILGSEIWGEALSLIDAEVVFPSSPAVATFIESLLVSSALLRQEGVLLLDLLTVTDGSLILTIGGLKITVHVRDGKVTATVRDGTVTAKVRDGTIQTTVR